MTIYRLFFQKGSMEHNRHHFIGGTDVAEVFDGIFAGEAVIHTLPQHDVVQGEIVDDGPSPHACRPQPDMDVLDPDNFIVEHKAVSPPPDEMSRIRNSALQSILDRMRKDGVYLVAGSNGIVPYFADILSAHGIPDGEWVEFVFDALATFHYELRDAEHTQRDASATHAAA